MTKAFLLYSLVALHIELTKIKTTFREKMNPIQTHNNDYNSMNDSLTEHTVNNKRRVSFAPYCTQRYTLHINDYTDDEINASWYNRLEVKQIRSQVKQLLQEMAAVGNSYSMQEQEDCIQGLEGCIDRLVGAAPGDASSGCRRRNR